MLELLYNWMKVLDGVLISLFWPEFVPFSNICTDFHQSQMKLIGFQPCYIQMCKLIWIKSSDSNLSAEMCVELLGLHLLS